MSYSTYLNTARGNTIFDLGNYTSNVCGAWGKALGRGLDEFDGMKASDAAPFFRDAVLRMLESPEEYESLMPDNDWGDYEGTLGYLQNIYLHCMKEPDGVLYMHY
jgi:hypothetical protein